MWYMSDYYSQTSFTTKDFLPNSELVVCTAFLNVIEFSNPQTLRDLLCVSVLQIGGSRVNLWRLFTQKYYSQTSK